jgi:type III secretion system low calcium response chaperone LcrH/SycD
MATIDEQIKAITDSIKDQVSPKELKLQRDALEKILKEGKGVYEAVGVSKDSLEYIYSHGYSLYKAGKYDDAIRIFHILNFLNGNDPRFTFSLAACHHMKKNYPEALVLYMTCRANDGKNPVLMWHIADCYLGMGKKMNALLCLRLAARFAQEDARFDPLRVRAEGEAATLEKELDEEFSKVEKK